MKTYREELKTQQHEIAREIKIDAGHLVMAKLHVPVASSNKLSPRFTGPYRVVDNEGGNKYKIQDLKSLEVTIRHADDLKKVNMKLDAMVDNEELHTQTDETQTKSLREDEDLIDDSNETHEYRKKLRSQTQRLRQSNSNIMSLICNIIEFFLQNEFDDYVNHLLEELTVDVDSSYR